MTARYRCPFCGSFASNHSEDTRKHILKAHRRALEGGLRIIEAFDTLDKEILP